MSFYSFFVAAMVASASARSMVLEQVPVLPADWKKLDNTVSPDDEVSFSIALRQPKVDIPSLMAKGRQHISRDDVRSLRAPEQSSVDSVMKWLNDENISDVTQEHDLIRVTTTVAEAEKLLGSKFNHYAFDDKVAKLRTQEYSIPEELNDAISFIHPVSNFMRPMRNEVEVSGNLANMKAANENAAASSVPCSDHVGINCLKKLYNITYESPDTNSPVRFGIAGYLEENANHRDLQIFLNQQTNISNYDFAVEKVNNGSDPGTPAGLEAMLDIEYGMGLAYPAPVTYYATGGRGTKLGTDGKPLQGKKDDNEPYLDFLNYLLEKAEDELPHVLSVSYGDDELSVPKEYAKRVCDAYGLLVKRGTTVIHSTGDGGSAGGRKGGCRSRDGKNIKTTMPTFPPSCPWVTAVGASVHGTEPQVGADFSSGGFSYYFERPSWQTGPADYIKGLDGHLEGYYNKNGRAMPDISIVGDKFYIIRNGYVDYAYGTSASAPTFAAMITLVNDARLRAGKPSLGWINDILYSEKGIAALSDVTKGSSYKCDFANAGWPAAEGWDAITGLGEPRDFSKLMDLLFAA